MWTGPSFVGVVNEGEGEKRFMNENDDEKFFWWGRWTLKTFDCKIIWTYRFNISTTRALDQLDVHLPIGNDL